MTRSSRRTGCAPTPASPVTVRQLAAFHTQGNTATFFWHAKASTSTSTVLTHVGVDGQSILPRKNDAGNTVAPGHLHAHRRLRAEDRPRVERPDPQQQRPRTTPTAARPRRSAATTCGSGPPRTGRARSSPTPTWWRWTTRASTTTTTTTSTWSPTSSRRRRPTPSAPGLVPGASALQLEFDAAVGRHASPTRTARARASARPSPTSVTSPSGSNSYLASLLDLDTTAGGSLRVTSSGTATEGTNGGNDNTLVNGLRLPFDGTGDPFSVVARIAGPVTQYDEGSEQAGVQLGNDQDNFVKVAVIEKTVGATTGPGHRVPRRAGRDRHHDRHAGAHAQPRQASPASTWRCSPTRAPAPSGRPTAPTVAPGPCCRPRSTCPRPSRASCSTCVRYAGLLVSHKGGQQLVARFESFGVVQRQRDGWRSGCPRGAAAARHRLVDHLHRRAGNVWAADTGRFTPTTAPNEGTRTDAIAGTTEDPLYATYRGNTGCGDAAHADLHAAHQGRDQGRPAAALRRAGRGQQRGRQAALRHRRRGRDRASGTSTSSRPPAASTPPRCSAINNVTVKGGSLELALKATADYPAISAIEVLCQGACPVDTTAPAAPTGLTARRRPGGRHARLGRLPRDRPGRLPRLPVGQRRRHVHRADQHPGRHVDVRRHHGAGQRRGVLPRRGRSTPPTTSPPPSERRLRHPARAGAAAGAHQHRWTGTDGQRHDLVRLQQHHRVQRLGQRRQPLQRDRHDHRPACGHQQHHVPVGVDRHRRPPVSAPSGSRCRCTNGAYRVRLHFAELNKTAANTRTFDVRLESTTVLSNFDIWAQAGGIDKAIVRQFPATVTDGVDDDRLHPPDRERQDQRDRDPAGCRHHGAPSAPASLTATGSGTGRRPELAGGRRGDDTAGYNVYRSTSADGTFTKLNGAALTATSYSDTTRLRPGRVVLPGAHRRHVGQHLGPGRGAAVRPAPVPAQVTGLAATGSQTGIALTWTASDATGLTGYNVYRSTTATRDLHQAEHASRSPRRRTTTPPRRRVRRRTTR